MDGLSDDRAALIDRLKQHVDRLAGLIGPRHTRRPQALDAAAALVEHELTQSGYTVQQHPYVTNDQRVVNLVAEVAGTDLAREIVVLGAHYDTVPVTPGADDNASAVAVLLEVARLFRPFQPRRTVRFVAFPCEEPPHYHSHDMGSQVYARLCREQGAKIVGMLCLEMVGYYTNDGQQNLPRGIPRFLRFAFPRRGDFLAAVGNLRSVRLLWQFRRGFKRAVNFPLFSIALPELIDDIRRSDNSSFWDQGYPALMLTDTSYLRNPHYHMATDTPDTLDYGCMAQVTHGVLGGLARIAKAP